jgi:hypothetical protein
MLHTCTERTDLDELIGNEHWEGQRLMFHYGPLPRAMKGGEELIRPHDGFRLTLR